MYNYQYYSGADISIYFGNTWVDEINAIQFSMEEKVAPIYGYADYMYSHLAKGTRTVYGKFIINYTEVGYLKAILQKLETSKLPSMPNSITREKLLINNNKIDEKNFDEFADYYESLVWGEKDVNTVDNARTSYNSPNLSKTTFDIIIGYGAVPGSANNSISSVSGFSKAGSTVQIIKNATIYGKSQIIDSSDNVISEEYSFIAQDII